MLNFLKDFPIFLNCNYDKKRIFANNKLVHNV